MRLALLQITSGDDPSRNAEMVAGLARDAAAGADAIFTPEVTNCVSLDRPHLSQVLRTEDDDETLAALRQVAAEASTWISIGSLALKGAGDRFLNRSFVIAPDGEVHARYDKLHMFDVQISETETFRESAAFAPGDTAVLTAFGDTRVGLAVCYDLRFAYLFRDLAQAGATIITVPAAFSPETGVAHWEVLLRARAIETGSWIVAAAQTGEHPSTTGKRRRTWGHSMVVGPWGDVVARLDDEPGILRVEIDPALAERTRRRVPSLEHDRTYQGPT